MLTSVLAALAAISTFAQVSQAPGKETRIYDPKTETTITGVIQKMNEMRGFFL